MTLVRILCLPLALGLGSGLWSFPVSAGPAGEAPAAPPAQGASMTWAGSFETAMEQARAEQKFVMIDFYTTWCYWCKVLDARTFGDARVAQVTAKLVCVKVNAEVEVTVARKYGVRAYPTIVFLNPDGTLRSRIQGFQGPESMTPILQDVIRTDAELAALVQQVRSSPKDEGMRRNYTLMLAQAGRFREAAAQADTLLECSEEKGEARSGLELDRWVYLHRAGEDASAVRKGLEKWVNKAKGHPRRLEGEYFCAQAEERDGRGKEARKLYQEICRVSPGSWFGQAARGRISGSS